MQLPVMPPVSPMLATSIPEVPEGEFLYEPKWERSHSKSSPTCGTFLDWRPVTADGHDVLDRGFSVTLAEDIADGFAETTRLEGIAALRGFGGGESGLCARDGQRLSGAPRR